MYSSLMKLVGGAGILITGVTPCDDSSSCFTCTEWFDTGDVLLSRGVDSACEFPLTFLKGIVACSDVGDGYAYSTLIIFRMLVALSLRRLLKGGGGLSFCC